MKKLIVVFMLIASSVSAIEITRNQMDGTDPTGWTRYYWDMGNGSFVPSDSPDSGNALQVRFPAGISDGSDPLIYQYQANSPQSDVYIQFYHRFGTSTQDYNWHPVANKILYMYSEGLREGRLVFEEASGSVTIQVYGDDPNREAAIYQMKAGRPNSGTWYKYAFHFRMNSAPGATDGILEAWIDDVRTVYETNVMYFDSTSTVTGIFDYEISPAYGGAGGANPSVCYTYYDGFIIQTHPFGGDTSPPYTGDMDPLSNYVGWPVDSRTISLSISDPSGVLRSSVGMSINGGPTMRCGVELVCSP